MQCRRTISMYFFFVLHQFTVRKFGLDIQPGNHKIRFFFFYFNHVQNFHILTKRNDITASRRLRSTTSITTLTLWGHQYGK